MSYGKIISPLRRCEPLVACANRQDAHGFFKEAENVSCDGWEAKENPEWLLEIENSITIRRRQADVARRMIKPETQENTVLQLNMGEGKTSVITPMVVSKLANGRNLLRIIVLKPLLRQSVNLLSQRLGGLLNRQIYHVPCWRNTPVDANTVKQLETIYEECQQKRGFLIALPEHILSFHLLGLVVIDSDPNLALKLSQTHQSGGTAARDM